MLKYLAKEVKIIDKGVMRSHIGPTKKGKYDFAQDRYARNDLALGKIYDIYAKICNERSPVENRGNLFVYLPLGSRAGDPLGDNVL